MCPDRPSYYFYLIRHGESDLNGIEGRIGGQSPRAKLTERGRAQAEAARLKVTAVTDVCTSPINRAVETAEIIFPGKHLSKVQALAERFNGQYENCFRQDVFTPALELQKSQSQEYFHLGYGETQRQVERRISGFVEDAFLNRYDELEGDVHVALVSHRTAIKCLLHHILGFDTKFLERIEIGYASVSRVRFNNEGWHLLSING